MSHGLRGVMLQSTQQKVILHGLWELTSECQVISHGSSVTSIVLMVQNGRKCITRILYNKTIVDLCFGRHGVNMTSTMIQ